MLHIAYGQYPAERVEKEEGEEREERRKREGGEGERERREGKGREKSIYFRPCLLQNTPDMA